MGVETSSWEDLLKEAVNRDSWKARVTQLKLTTQHTTKPTVSKEQAKTIVKIRSVITTRFTFFTKKHAKKQTLTTTTTTRGNRIYTLVSPPTKRNKPKPKRKIAQFNKQATTRVTHYKKANERCNRGRTESKTPHTKDIHKHKVKTPTTTTNKTGTSHLGNG